MKHFSKLVACLSVLVLLASCNLLGNKIEGKQTAKVVQKKLTPRAFNSVCNYSDCDVSFVQSDSTYVLLRGKADEIDKIDVSFDGKTLNITRKEKSGFFGHGGEVKIIVSSPDLQFVCIAGTGDFTCGGVVYAEKMDVELDGTGDAVFSDVECNAMTLNVSGTGDFSAKRIKTLAFDVTSDGTGDVSAMLQETDEVSLVSSGTGDIEIKFSNCGRVSCDLSGTGDANLSGNVSQLLKSVSGTGDLDTENLKIE
jgi:hypothetical protein